MSRRYYEHRASGSFGTGFGLSCGCLAGVLAFLVGAVVLIVALCAGAVHLGDEARQRQRQAEEQKGKVSPPGTPDEKPAEPEPGR